MCFCVCLHIWETERSIISPGVDKGKELKKGRNWINPPVGNFKMFTFDFCRDLFHPFCPTHICTHSQPRVKMLMVLHEPLTSQWHSESNHLPELLNNTLTVCGVQSGASLPGRATMMNHTCVAICCIFKSQTAQPVCLHCSGLLHNSFKIQNSSVNFSVVPENRIE